jgi:hypothetical protein
MNRNLQALLVLVLGAAAIIGAYRMSAATSAELMATNERLSQSYRCIIAQGRSLRGATTRDCADYWRHYGEAP